MFTKTLVSVLVGMVCESLAQYIGIPRINSRTRRWRTKASFHDYPYKYSYQPGGHSFAMPTGSISTSTLDLGSSFGADQIGGRSFSMPTGSNLRSTSDLGNSFGADRLGGHSFSMPTGSISAPTFDLGNSFGANQHGGRSFSMPTGSILRSTSDLGNSFGADRLGGRSFSMPTGSVSRSIIGGISSLIQPRRRQYYDIAPTFDRRTRGFDRYFGNSAAPIPGFDGIFTEKADHPLRHDSNDILSKAGSGLRELIGSFSRNSQRHHQREPESGLEAISRELLNIRCFRGSNPDSLLNIECFNGSSGSRII